MKFCGGIDWSDAALDYELGGPDGSVLVEGQVRPNVEGLAELFARLEAHAPAGEIGIAIETTHGPWVQALLDRGFVVYPVNPKTADHFRKALSASGDKSDSIDKHVLAVFLRSCHRELRPLKPDDPAIIALRIACEDRLRLVEERTAKLNELIAALKMYYPAALGLFGNLESQISLTFLADYPTQSQMRKLEVRHFKNWLRKHQYNHPGRIAEMIAALSQPVLPVPAHLQEAKAGRIVYLARSVLALTEEIAQRDDRIGGQFALLPESDWISSLPRAGKVLGPALLACVGRDVQRFANVNEARSLMGTAPVTKSSGRSRVVYMRRACWKFARRTLQLFAEQTRRCCAWAMEFYQRQRASGHGHHAALRALAHKWLKIILAMQRSGTRYDEARFTHSRERYLLNARTRSSQTLILERRV
jgi:transposase